LADRSDYDISGVIAIADAIPDMGALTKFDISNNSLYAAGAKALAAGLKGNHRITKLNLGGNGLGWKGVYQNADMSGVIALADAIPDMGALIKLDISSNYIGAKQKKDLQRICMASGIELDM
jgi:Ran GTPase-activating protein (RanGAP) involved in mRNA processing and transport